MKKIVITLFVISFAFSAGAQQKVNKKSLKELVNRMTGSFSSEVQSKSDSAYFDIRLHMARIWKKRTDGYWLYVEQAVASSMSKPYRQRIYHVYLQDDTTLVSKVFEMNSPKNFIGAWNNTAVFKSLTTDSLIDRQGCALYLHKNADGNYYGSTPGKECLSSLRGAKYATSEAIVEVNRLVSWDRGWDDKDKQKWGAEKGGYQFLKD